MFTSSLMSARSQTQQPFFAPKHSGQYFQATNTEPSLGVLSQGNIRNKPRSWTSPVFAKYAALPRLLWLWLLLEGASQVARWPPIPSGGRSQLETVIAHLSSKSK